VTFSIGFFVDSVTFTPAVIAGDESLGGSESACLGLARALRRQGHDVHIFTTKITEDALGPDHGGVVWHDAAEHGEFNQLVEWDVFVALRTLAPFFGRKVRARLRVLWNQDLLIGNDSRVAVMAAAYALDSVVYVSDFHRQQWELLVPELKGLAHVTKNGFDPTLVPAEATKDPNRIIHITRPERGLRPLLAMWPEIRRRAPHAELHLCRYSSMYDPGGFGQICAQFDAEVEAVNAEVGGITYLGELGKPALYKAIADAAVMFYPGVKDFAETSCIAALEAQANGTPFVGSYKGALPETVPSGVLIRGDAESPEYQELAVAAVVEMLDGCRRQTVMYRHRQKAGRAHVESYTYDAIAAEWLTWLERTFRARYEGSKLGVLRQLLHYDDITAAQRVAEEISRDCPGCDDDQAMAAAHVEAVDAMQLCTRVIAGKEHTASDYTERALGPLVEIEHNPRFKQAAERFKDCTHVLDLACGTGGMALLLAKTFPDIRVTALDYAPGNIARANEAAAQLGVSDRCTFIESPVYDFETQQPVDLRACIGDGIFNGVFVGEFLEHVGDCVAMVDAVEALVTPDAPVVFTVPHGPMVELQDRTAPYRRSHVHHFQHRDLAAVFGKKRAVDVNYIPWGGQTVRGDVCGNWIISYRASDAPTGARPYEHLIITTRPLRRLSVGILATNAGTDLPACLASVWPIADEIIVGLAAADAETRRVCATFDATYETSRIRTIDLPAVHDIPDGFAGARNAILAAATGDAFLWIDTDERLVDGGALWKFLETGPYKGYAIKQIHMHIDAAPTFDKPVRVFFPRPEIQFYGAVHEQPQWGDANTDIIPAMGLEDVAIMHLGYVTEGIRRVKQLSRNRPLLVRDQERFRDRELGRVLWIREFVQMAGQDRARYDGALTPAAKQYYTQAIGIFEKHFGDPAHKYHKLARPFYEEALTSVNGALEAEFALIVNPNGLGKARALPERVWCRTLADIERQLQHRLELIRKAMQPTPTRVDPFEDATQEDTPADAVQEAPASIA
jgi:glycosyltransferase involved in cell wall biosynthesis/SAM-dependent methyltransferase